MSAWTALLEPSGISWLALGAVLAVLSDGFLPFVPSGSVVIAAGMQSTEDHHSPLPLVLLVAAASFAGDLVLLQCARRGAGWAQRRLARKPKWAEATGYVLETIRTKPARTVITARFVPGGRTVLDLAVGTSPVPMRRFLHWSALSALVWAVYMVGLSWVDERWLDVGWLSFLVSCVAAFGVSGLVASGVRRGRRRARAAAVPAPRREPSGDRAGAGERV
ncbi:DedA family protein [Phaeacidiphilus oryzae]|uniref:DedA family protein n=1 Tax=Phaeacidiphilus oryzae TaxID=348818 RepID=UPI00068B700B|nr:VTT domain-containing protein [Phaeacidiphilus oryzae]